MSLPCLPPAKTEPTLRNAECPKEEESATPTIYSDVVNVSEGFQLRTAYKKKVKASKLDGLLERRVRQFTLEEKQRLERIRHTKCATTKLPTVSTRQQQQQPLTLSVKQEPKDEVVKQLDFEEEQKHDKESLGVQAELPEFKDKEMDSMEGNENEAVQLNGEPPAKTEQNSENRTMVVDVEKKESPEKMEGRPHGDEEQDNSTENMKADNSKPKLLQVNGSVEVLADADQAGHIQIKNKDPVKSLANGNLSQVDSSECQPPLSKVPKLENHVAVGEVKNEDMVESNKPLSLPSSITLCPSSNSTDCKGATIKVSQSTTPPQVASTNQTSTVALQSYKAEPLGPEAKPATAPSGSMTISKEYSTRDKVSLLKFSKTKKARSGTALPSYRKFVTKSSKKSIFILPNDDLKRLARRGSIREVPNFNYNAKPALDIWPYPSPRPTFGITWRLISIFQVLVF